MSNPEPVISEGSANAKFPEADVDRELHLGNTDNSSLQEDSVSAQITASKEIKEQEVEEKKKKEEEKKEDTIHKMKSTVIISGVIVAVIGGIFAVTKKLREN
ncbi:hypothetical protein MKW94_004870 [Papaver nudicaule]|uniref:Uncharacterized protein n=1 Tax=Papaver nudicaule TaxID=74823 RepID=A0AA41RX77_PAPNU|nr:hypothetical protein [Papaver nudicaule]